MNRVRDRDVNRETDRNVNRETDRDMNRQTDRNVNRETDRNVNNERIAFHNLESLPRMKYNNQIIKKRYLSKFEIT